MPDSKNTCRADVMLLQETWFLCCFFGRTGSSSDWLMSSLTGWRIFASFVVEILRWFVHFWVSCLTQTHLMLWLIEVESLCPLGLFSAVWFPLSHDTVEQHVHGVIDVSTSRTFHNIIHNLSVDFSLTSDICNSLFCDALSCTLCVLSRCEKLVSLSDALNPPWRTRGPLASVA